MKEENFASYTSILSGLKGLSEIQQFWVFRILSECASTPKVSEFIVEC